MNIAEIAKLAGVSSAAVSRYFNNGYVSEQKREAIRKVVEQTGYKPSVQAQTLRTKKTKMIGVIVPKIASASIGRITEGILSVLNESEYQMLLAVTQNNPNKEVEYLTVFNEKMVDGVILVATIFTPKHRRILKNIKVPVVIVGQRLSECCCIYNDDYSATYEITKLLLEKGRKNLGYIGAINQDKAVGAERYKGFSDAVSDMGYAGLSKNHIIASFTMASGYEKTGELLKKCGNLDGLICATDTMAAGAVQYLSEYGIKIPEQIIVAGQGDSEISKVTPLITVRYFYEKSGQMAVQMLFENLNKKEIDLKEIKLGYCIVEH